MHGMHFCSDWGPPIAPKRGPICLQFGVSPFGSICHHLGGSGSQKAQISILLHKISNAKVQGFGKKTSKGHNSATVGPIELKFLQEVGVDLRSSSRDFQPPLGFPGLPPGCPSCKKKIFVVTLMEFLTLYWGSMGCTDKKYVYDMSRGPPGSSETADLTPKNGPSSKKITYLESP